MSGRREGMLNSNAVKKRRPVRVMKEHAALGDNHSWTKDSARITADALAALGRADEAAEVRARYRIEHEGQRAT